MLCQFTFKNFKSYKDETVFDMQASSIKEFEDSLITFEKDKKRLLPVSVFYGPNGGGKSNMLWALYYLTQRVNMPKLVLKNKDIGEKITSKLFYQPFKFDSSSKNESTEYQIFFRTNGSEFRYNITFLEESVVEEYLYRVSIGGKKPEMLFARYDGEIELGEKLRSAKVATSVNSEMPYLAFLGTMFNINEINEVMKWFEKVTLLDFSDNTRAELIKFLQVYTDMNLKETLISMFQCMDIGIQDYRIDNEQNLYTIRVINGEKVELSLEEESMGTQKLFSLLPLLIKLLDKGCVLIVDELDTKLHPKLLRYIVSLFINKKINKNGAQLIFTAHDISIMRSDLFRRDEIWFAAKDENEASQIYSLYDIRDENNEHIRTTAAFDKQYMEGRYGADPYLQRILDWEVQKDE